MTGGALASAAVSVAVLGGAWLGWELLGDLVGRLGLTSFDPLARVALAFGALSALDAALSRPKPPADPP